jgi:hypothetical protein
MVRGNDSFHRLPHLAETARNAVMLAGAEGADRDACWAAAMLHDICKSRRGDHGSMGARDASAFLRSLGLPGAFVRSVGDAIRFHNKGFRRGPAVRRVLWDSDKLPLTCPSGFRRRMLPYWTAKLGRREGVRRSVREYYFYVERLHTKSGRAFASRQGRKMEKLIARLEKSDAGL